MTISFPWRKTWQLFFDYKMSSITQHGDHSLLCLLFSLSLYPFPNLGPCGTNIHTPHITHYTHTHQPFTYALAISNDPVVKKLPASAGNMRALGSIPGLGRSPEGGHGNPLYSSCLENHLDSRAWQTTVHRVTKCWTRLKQLSMHAWLPIVQMHYVFLYLWAFTHDFSSIFNDLLLLIPYLVHLLMAQGPAKNPSL